PPGRPAPGQRRAATARPRPDRRHRCGARPMSGRAPAGAELLVRGDAVRARELVEEFFVDRGWRARERGPGRVDYERGSRRRTRLLGALAGRRFHVTARIALRAGRTSTTRDGTVPERGTETTSVHYGGGAED